MQGVKLSYIIGGAVYKRQTDTNGPAQFFFCVCYEHNMVQGFEPKADKWKQDELHYPCSAISKIQCLHNSAYNLT